MLEGLRQKRYVHSRDLDHLHRFVSAGHGMLRRNCIWAEFAYSVLSAKAEQTRFRRWGKKGT